MKRVVIIQARTNSSRLPGKVLLPLNGIPLVVLAAKRAANQGMPVIVATSLEASDDSLVRVLEKYGLECFRGSLENTLKRFVDALAPYDDDTLVFRLTGDNVFPDGQLLSEIENDFKARGLEYISCDSSCSGLPYGVSVELTYAKHFRAAQDKVLDNYDREHVTPWIRRKFGEAYFEKYKIIQKGHFRSTVDNLDDYLAVEKVFAGVLDPVSEPFMRLVELLETQDYQPNYNKPASKMILGTAQFGFDYGVANESGKPNPEQAEALIKTAIVNGVAGIDTAHEYGDSEYVVGQALNSGWKSRVRVITKLSTLSGCPDDASQDTVNAFVDASFYKSLSSLGTSSIDTLLLHRAEHLVKWDGSAWERLLFHKEHGCVTHLGVSVQSIKELELALSNVNVGLVQLPYNLLDWRWDSIIPSIVQAQQKRGLEVHVRSCFLQGLLPSLKREHWTFANVEQPSLFIQWLNEQINKYGFSDVSGLCLGVVQALDWIDGVVLGIDDMSQLHKNLSALQACQLSKGDVQNILSERPLLSEKSLNPALWGVDD